MSTVTPTPTITTTPTITPTPTPPPDLELTNISIYPDTYNVAGQGYDLLARIRNNTKTTMILYDTKKVFSFTVESWEYDQQMKLGFDAEYFYAKYQFDVKAGGDFRIMNCILYPGEEGIAVIGFSSFGQVDTIKFDKVPKYDGPLGLWYTYQSFYDTRPDLPRGFHYQAENITFQNIAGNIAFDFDLNILANHIYPDFGSMHFTWVIFYDKDEKILDVLKKDLVHYYPGYYTGKQLHIHSITADAIENPEYFEPAIEVTPELAAKVDHLEVISELEEDPVCQSGYNK